MVLAPRGVEVAMSNDFLVLTEEMFLVDDGEFFANGGVVLTFGELDGDSVSMHVEGSRRSITCLARHIVEHHTAAH
jgi:hypothetical protein